MRNQLKVWRRFKEVEPIEYNPAIPIETFDIIVTDECHRSIYHLWRQVLEYFDAHIIGLTATPNKQTFGFFNQNLVMEYGHEQAVADGVNVNYDVYRIKTEITEGGSKVEAGYFVDKRDRATRAVRWEQLDEELEYDANQLDRDVVTPDQIRTVVRTYRDKLFTDIFPGRTEVPKTLIFAKDDSHAEDIVKIVREEFGKGNDFCPEDHLPHDGQKTRRPHRRVPQQLLPTHRRHRRYDRHRHRHQAVGSGALHALGQVPELLRADEGPRCARDQRRRPEDPSPRTPKPRTITSSSTPSASASGTRPTPARWTKGSRSRSTNCCKPSLSGNTEPEVISSIAVRLSRMNKTLEDEDKAEIEKKSGGKSLAILTNSLVNSLDGDRHVEQAKKDNNTDQPTSEQVQQAAAKMIQEAVKPLYDPTLRNLLIELKKRDEQTIDNVSQDKVIEAAFSADALERAKGVVQSFEKFIQDHRDEITALQILYNRPYKQPLRFEDIKELANTIQKPPHLWTESQLWQAYAALDKSKVKGTTAKRILTDLVSLVRFAIHQDNELVPFPERVNANFKSWLAQQEASGHKFASEQRRWLEMIRDHIAANLGIDPSDFDYAPFAQEGGLGKVHQLFGDDLNKVIEELNGTLAA